MQVTTRFTYKGKKKFGPNRLAGWVIICFFCGIQLLSAQTENPTKDELLENFFRDNEQASEYDAQQWLEYLENLQADPLDLNLATRDELETLRLLDALKIEQFLAYRAKFGPFLTTYELQAIPGWTVEDVRHILEYSRVATTLDSRQTPLRQGWQQGNNELLMRWGFPQPYTRENGWEGGASRFALRYRHNFDNRLRFGFTAENDAGEAFFKGSNRQGFDFYSAHLFFKPDNRWVKTLAIGDFGARFGQGLLLQSGFAPGKTAETMAVARSINRMVYPYAAFGEALFFRGGATTLSLGRRLEATLLFSHRRRDSNVLLPDSTDQEYEDLRFTALQTSGLHRTNAEVSDEKTLTENVGGVNFSYNLNNGQIAVNGLWVGYDKPWSPAPATYRVFGFQGKSLLGVSMSYNYRYRNTLWFGETARSDNGGWATLNGLLLGTDRHISFSVIQRDFAPNYHAIYANPFSETTGAANEKGLFMGADIRWIRRVQINLYTDVWRHPWLRFGVSGPSTGSEYLARVVWTKNKVFTATAQWQLEQKMRDGDPEINPGLVTTTRNRLRLHCAAKVGAGLEMRSRVEWNWFKEEGAGTSTGFLAYQEIVYKPWRLPVSGSVRYALFDTDSYDARVYAYENDLFSAVSIPAYSGQGRRYYVNLTWRLNKWLRLEGRFETTDTTKAGSSTGLTGKETLWKIQARAKW